MNHQLLLVNNQFEDIVKEEELLLEKYENRLIKKHIEDLELRITILTSEYNELEKRISEIISDELKTDVLRLQQFNIRKLCYYNEDEIKRFKNKDVITLRAFGLRANVFDILKYNKSPQ
jgi:hypothetical protein